MMTACREVVGADPDALALRLWLIHTGKIDGYGPRERLEALKLMTAYGHGRPVETSVQVSVDAEKAERLDLPIGELRSLAKSLSAPKKVPELVPTTTAQAVIPSEVLEESDAETAD